MGLMSIQLHNSLQSGLVAGWQMEEASGAVRNDIFGINNLTDNNTVGQSTGIIGNDATFIANNATSLTVTPSARMIFTNKMTMTCWTKRDATAQLDDGTIAGTWPNTGSNNQLIWQLQRDSGSQQPRILISTDGTINNFSFATGNQAASSTSTFTSSVFQYDGTQSTDATKMAVYTNNVLNTLSFLNFGTATGVPSTLPSIGAGNYMIGKSFGASNTTGFQGGIDQYFIWNRPLSPYERDILYNGGNALHMPF